MRKRQATFFGHDEKRDTRTSCGNWNGRGETQREKMLDGLTKWLKVGRVTEALKATRDRDAWKVTIAYANEHGTWLIDWFKTLNNS